MTSHVSALAKQVVETNIAAGKAAVAIKTPQDLTILHSSWASQMLESAMAGSLKLSEISTKISTQAAAPIQSHVSDTIGKMSGGIFNATAKVA